ncbi:pyruvate dehydrogenase (acetyl-transferring), homodimeric type [Lysobacter sp. MMG2]|uniref:pyruvate dehydrogenase (acetyl-transferring), homodimeric type n=1 Tax=Lysobacter sp. MMG2 TaxID=2801338 RepID=UPI001C24C64A|nr:pyruvate dehydrogenase (acetyl-transferring), homodimeric type [Lysobacter sp. MMG2]MBU8974794.1 pyruvate dehydrogenase (acetyl-transferring), homodimeric type [Lysobacter sp. MMG2]
MSAPSDHAYVPHDADPTETREWLDALGAVLHHDGADRASYLVSQLNSHARRSGGIVDFNTTTDYVNTIPVGQQALSPGDPKLEKRIRDIIRWNAMAMVVRANRKPGELGGHLASFASSAVLYETGFNHFWRAPSDAHPGDLIFTQGHSSPGIYARSFLEGRFDEAQLDLFRMEVEGKGRGLSSYPHPWLMPEYWQVATVSMGLGPLQAIYQAHFWRYLEQRGLMPASDRKVWALLGDGEIDEPETVGALALAARERLDNLVFVINCNLQRLDGPVRGNGKIIQEVEGVFRGAGWNVIKTIWGSRWDPLLAKDTDGELRRIMMETVDGEYQAYKTLGGAYTREHFFGKSESTRALVEGMSDHDIEMLNRGGHDPVKVYAAYDAAVRTKGQPTVILAKSIKGYGLGDQYQSQNANHNKKKIDLEALKYMRDRLSIPIPDDRLDEVPYFHPGPDSHEVRYLQEHRAALGGTLPRRRPRSSVELTAPPLSAFDALLQSSGEREISTTMAMVRAVNLLLRDKEIGPRVVPVIADEARTFGMEGLFRQVGIYAPFGQRYTPNDSSQLVYYREAADGQVLQEGISEAGGISSWIAAGTSYSVNDVPMLPFFFYYAMFGFQRVGDLAWAAADMRARGFLVGGTAGRTTINGEGLQHEDGHSHLMSGAIPNVVSYDPTFAYEVAVIVREGVRRMLQEQEDVYFYLTVMNEAYAHPAMPEGSEEGILRGMYLLAPATELPADAPRVQLLGAGTILREAIAAAEMLRKDFGVAADVWSCPSFSELRRDGFHAERWNRLHPGEPERVPYVTSLLNEHPGPVIAATDYVRGLADQIRAFIPQGRRYTVLGTDGFGRSDTRWNLRAYFEVDRRWIAHAAVLSLARDGVLPTSAVAKAADLYGIDADKAEPALG